MRKAEFWLAQLIDTIALAERLGVDKATLGADLSKALHQRICF